MSCFVLMWSEVGELEDTGRCRPTAETWVGCAGDLCWGFSLGVGAARPTARLASGRPSGVCPRWPSWVWWRGGMSLWPWPPLPGWRCRGTSSPRPRGQHRLAWLPWGSAVAVMLGCPSPAGRSQHRRVSSAPTRTTTESRKFFTILVYLPQHHHHQYCQQNSKRIGATAVKFEL